MIEPGLQATVEETVSEGMTAASFGSGDVEVLATPAVLAMAEAASVEALAGALEEGTTTVGAAVELEHIAPTAVGAIVIATSGLTGVDGRRLTFSFEVTDPAGPIARGTHRRVVVDRDRFMETAEERLPGD